MEQQPQDDDGTLVTANINGKPQAKLKAEIDFKELELGIDAPHLSDDEAFKFLDLLWEVMMTFVELGFGSHPTQQVHSKEDIQKELAVMADRIFKAAA